MIQVRVPFPLKHLGVKTAPELMYFVMEKELLKLSELAPKSLYITGFYISDTEMDAEKLWCQLEYGKAEYFAFSGKCICMLLQKTLPVIACQ